MQTCYLDAPVSALAALRLPELEPRRALRDEIDGNHQFSTSQDKMGREFPGLVRRLGKNGMR